MPQQVMRLQITRLQSLRATCWHFLVRNSRSPNSKASSVDPVSPRPGPHLNANPNDARDCCTFETHTHTHTHTADRDLDAHVRPWPEFRRLRCADAETLNSPTELGTTLRVRMTFVSHPFCALHSCRLCTGARVGPTQLKASAAQKAQKAQKRRTLLTGRRLLTFSWFCGTASWGFRRPVVNAQPALMTANAES